MYRRPYAVYLNAIAALVASLLFFVAVAAGSFKVAKADAPLTQNALVKVKRLESR